MDPVKRKVVWALLVGRLEIFSGLFWFKEEAVVVPKATGQDRSMVLWRFEAENHTVAMEDHEIGVFPLTDPLEHSYCSALLLPVLEIFKRVLFLVHIEILSSLIE